MDITQRDLLLRALASPARLDMLNLLFRAPPAPPGESPGITPTGLAASLSISRSAVSHHLKVLLRMRLVRYWKKGVRKFYTVSRPRPGTIRERMLGALAESLPPAEPALRKKPTLTTRPRGRPARHRDIAKSPLAEVWGALTAFSHFRRILIVQALRQKGGASRVDLMRAADLDHKTVKYHLSKLIRRGLLIDGDAGLTLCTKPPTRLHGLVLALVLTPGT